MPEAVQKITIDGKSKKACELKLIPEEADIVRLIYDLYMEHDSLTAVEAELIKRGLKTKNGKLFTRFSIKAILQTPVYMIADENAYNYLPPTEWIVAVGLHQGIVPGKVWISVQESLERNKIKAYRKPRNNEAFNVQQ